MRLWAIVTVALLVGVGAGTLGADHLTGTPRDHPTSDEAAQAAPPSRDRARQQRRAGEAAREVFPRGRVVEVERENVGRAQWEVELLVEGRLYEVRLDRSFGMLALELEDAGSDDARRGMGPRSDGFLERPGGR